MLSFRALSALTGLRKRRGAVVLQQDPTECAAACLAMVLDYHGRATSLAECRAALGPGRDGTTAQSIVQAARAQGLIARGFSAPAGDLAGVALPAIAHWEFKHFLVVERLAREHVDVVDPAQGRRRLPRAEFDAGFTGIVLVFEPGPEFVRRRGRSGFDWKSYLRQLVSLPGVRSGIAQILLASLVLQVLGLALPLFTKVVVDSLLPQRLENLFVVFALGMLAWTIAQATTGYLRSILLLQVRLRLDARVMLGFFEHLLALPFRYFQSRTSGDLLMRLSSNGVLRELLTTQAVSIVLDGVLVLGYLVLLFVLAPAFGAIALAIGVVQAFILLATTPHATRLTQRDLHAQSESQSYLVETLAGIATLKASGTEPNALAQWTRRFHAQLEASLARSHFATIVDALQSALRILSPLALLLVGARAVLAGEMSLGTMLALTALAGSFLAPLSSLLSTAQNLQVVGAHLERIADVLQAEPEQGRSLPAATTEPLEPARVQALRCRFELDHVSFRYAPASPDVLSDVSLAIEPGSKVALVGRTGSGKSTLGMLLLGLYPPTSGAVRLDGRPLADFDLRAVRQRFGVVLQDSSLFSGSIRDNIAFHDPELSFEEVVEAARLACIDEEIMTMAMGYETRLSEGGAGLSGGQKQRLALARALARKPTLLLLDEATSHLDVVTESRVDDNLARLSCTRVIIAHRLSTIRGADAIFVLDEGRIVEHGTHAELQSAAGAYAALIAQQTEG